MRDRGPGLTGEQRSRAFDRFWRGADATAEGSGLGLAIVAQLVRASGGWADLQPRDGGGLVAVATFPDARGAHAPERLTAAAPSGGDQSAPPPAG